MKFIQNLTTYGTCIAFLAAIRGIFVDSQTIIEDCSVPDDSSSRVVGGQKAKLGEYPYIVSIHKLDSPYPYKYVCAGSIIAEDIILTAAHCAKNVSRGLLEIHPNYNNTAEALPGQKVYSEARKVIHRGFNHNMDDIALLWLNESIPFGDTIKPARLPFRPWNTTGHIVQQLVVAGWGFTENLQMASYCLRCTTVDYQDESVCSSRYKDWAPGNICAGSQGKDTCNGDSGGPLIIKAIEEGQPDLLVGITSFGMGRCGSTSAGYVNLIRYIDWIRFNVGNDTKLDIDYSFG